MNFARFFRYVQDAPWYAHFLHPVLDALKPFPENSKVLDIGTGAGKLIEMGQKELNLQWAGADTDKAMLAEARQRSSLQNVPFELLAAGAPLPFPNQGFDAVTFCSVLFLIPAPTPMLEEAWRILRPGGSMIVLTPTGEGEVSPAFLLRIGLSPANSTFFLWRSMTVGSGRDWTKKKTLEKFAQKHEALYDQKRCFQDLAQLELVSKP
jgi:ubiquinone/menaquinone biosynthesis C-methylase UbiE